MKTKTKYMLFAILFAIMCTGNINAFAESPNYAAYLSEDGYLNVADAASATAEEDKSAIFNSAIDGLALSATTLVTAIIK